MSFSEIVLFIGLGAVVGFAGGLFAIGGASSQAAKDGGRARAGRQPGPDLGPVRHCIGDRHVFA
jgi:hypothetical protein